MDFIQRVKAKLDWFCNKRAHSTCWFDRCCGFDWSTCSKNHDRRYANTRLTRYQADKLLFRCVRCKSSIVMASIMFLGVRTFGWYQYNKIQRVTNDNNK